MRVHIPPLAVALLCAFELPSGHAYDERGQFVALGIGNNSCGQMTDDVRRSDYGRQVYETYMDGYLTAVNAEVRGSTNFYAGSDKVARFKFVLQYCDANPLDLVLNAVSKLVKHYKSD